MIGVRRLIVLVLALVLIAPAAVSADAASRAPVITKLSRTSGGYAGGITVEIYGKNLNGVSRISFDGINGLNLRRISTKHLIIWTPALKAGVHKVRVVSNHGISKPKLYRAINDGKASIVGLIRSAATNKTIVNGSVTLWRAKSAASVADRISVTGPTGWYRFAGVPAGTYGICTDLDQTMSALPPNGLVDLCTPGEAVYAFQPYDDRYPHLRSQVAKAGHLVRHDFSLARASGLAGRLVDRGTGKPVRGVYVTAVGLHDGQGGNDHLGQAITGADGIFRIGGLLPDAYSLCFDPTKAGRELGRPLVPACDRDRVWANSWGYPDRSLLPSHPSTFTVRAGVWAKTGTHSVPVGGWLKGTVIAIGTDTPVRDVVVDPHNDAWRPISAYNTTTKGAFGPIVLPVGTYEVCFTTTLSEIRVRCVSKVVITKDKTTSLRVSV